MFNDFLLPLNICSITLLEGEVKTRGMIIAKDHLSFFSLKESVPKFKKIFFSNFLEPPSSLWLKTQQIVMQSVCELISVALQDMHHPDWLICAYLYFPTSSFICSLEGLHFISNCPFCLLLSYPRQIL